jgi:hypothetical protein
LLSAFYLGKHRGEDALARLCAGLKRPRVSDHGVPELALTRRFDRADRQAPL